jgi:GntR family transcriptional regulator
MQIAAWNTNMAQQELIFDKISDQRSNPLYLQLYQLLRREIRAGIWKPGDQLPSEPQLVERYDVSRATVRQAMQELVADGLIERKRGRGSFVAMPSLEQNLVRIVSFTEEMQQRGLEPNTHLISATLMPATERIAAKLGVEPGQELARLERLRLADGQPMSVEVSCLVHRYCPNVLEYDFTQISLRQTLQREYDITLARAEQTIHAIAAEKEMAELLAIEPGEPLLYIERVSYSDYDVPVEYLRRYHRGDRYSLYNELRG